ncbi:MAG: guanylate kinase [Paludibacteraceae bacterium]|nr:guanylate kinase [Paludibacteraceae bacterium]
MKKGKLIIFSAPSGCGKSTIINALRERGMQFEFSVSATSRQPRGTEQDGIEYHFLTPEQFRDKIDNGEFIEYEEVYKDQFYGTLRSEVESRLNAGRNVIFDIDVKGAINVKRQYGNQAISMFIMPPSVEELSRRLHNRGTETEQQIEKRISKAQLEISYADQFDHIIVNNILEQAISETENIINNFLLCE